jgi:hypothetical protein
MSEETSIDKPDEFDLMRIDDNFGCQQLLKSLLPQCHMIDIRIRLDGKYYWFEGDYLKDILKHVAYNRIEKDIDCELKHHEELTQTK